jgi:endonuclease G
MSAGYDPGFLREAVDLPCPNKPVVLLDYTHFSVLLQPSRRLAAVVGVNINGAELRPLERSGTWHFDPRVPRGHQAGPEVYRNNRLDRGHLVRRLDPVWGDPETARRANQDTFAFPNAAPQAADFNQDKELWLGLEDHVLNHADIYDARLSVFTGPVLADDDLPYRGIRIPRQFWKVAAWTADGALASAGFVLDQSPLLEGLELEQAVRRRLAAGEPPPLGPFRTFQVPVSQIAGLAGIDLTRLAAADRLTREAGRGGRPAAGLRLEDFAHIRL